MKTIQSALFTALTAASLAGLWSCERERQSPEVCDGQILLRSSGTGSGALDEGDLVGFYCLRSTGDPRADILGERYYDNRQLTVSKGALICDIPLFYPNDYAGASDFYAYYPYSQPGLAAGKSEIEIKVYEDQSVDEYFALSDCKLARAQETPRRPGAVKLTFQRLMSKLDFVLVPGEGYGSPEAVLGARVTVKNVYRVGNVDYVSGTVGSPAIAGDITAHGTFSVGTDGSVGGVSAIVFPQHLNAGAELFTVQIGSRNFRGVLASDQTFKAGERYTYTLTVNRSSTGDEILVEASVDEWDEGAGAEGGTVEIDPDTDLDYAVDADGNEYGIVHIGDQSWLDSNLRTTSLAGGEPIRLIEDQTEWEECENTESPAYCYFENDPGNAASMGVLYNWYTVDREGLCPEGWRVPSLDDWKALGAFLGGEAGTRLKAASGWYDQYGDTSPSYQGTDEFRFNAVFAGNRRSNKGFGGQGYGEWWTSTVASTSTYSASIAYVYAAGPELKFGSTRFKETGQAVRCIKTKSK